jgi:hypothetical protein
MLGRRLLWVGFLIIGATVLLTPVAAAQETPEETAENIVAVTMEAAESTAAAGENLLDRLIQVPQSELARVFLIAGGLLLLLAGWRIYEYVVLIAGFLIGASVAASLVITDSTLISLVVTLIGGLIGAVLSVLVYYLAVFLIGAYVGIALTSGLGAALALAPVSSIALLLGGVIGGMVLLGLSFQFLIVLSALVGAQMLTLGLGLQATWTLILAVVGIIVQFMLVRSLHYEFPRTMRRPNPLRRVTG